MIDYNWRALIGRGKSLSLRQRLCRGFSMLECFSQVLLCASYVQRVVLTQELRLSDPWLLLRRVLGGVCRSLPRKATRPSYITIASHLSPVQPCYLLEWSAPPSLSRESVFVSRVRLLSCLVAAISSCRVPSCHCRRYCRPAHHSMTPKTTDHLILISALCDSADRN